MTPSLMKNLHATLAWTEWQWGLLIGLLVLGVICLLGGFRIIGKGTVMADLLFGTAFALVGCFPLAFSLVLIGMAIYARVTL